MSTVSHASRWERFSGSYYWLILKNLIGWPLIAASLVAGPLVPGPGGIPLFLIGFALVSFPGKRKLTARVLRGRPVRWSGRWFAMICAGVALIAPLLPFLIFKDGPWWLARPRAEVMARGSWAVAAMYLIVAVGVWVMLRIMPHAINVALRLAARGRRKFRPWLRHHHIRLLPPRWRTRGAHEPGHGPFQLTDEILRWVRHHRR